jgi:hypothetical protein
MSFMAALPQQRLSFAKQLSARLVLRHELDILARSGAQVDVFWILDLSAPLQDERDFRRFALAHQASSVLSFDLTSRIRLRWDVALSQAISRSLHQVLILRL